MRRRVLGAVAAVLLAVVGAVLLLSYVGAADRRAMAGMETVTVLVVAKPIAQGTPADQLGSRVNATALPAVAVPRGTVADLTEITGRVATTDLQPGEQLLASRFVDAATLRTEDEVRVPKGLQEVSVSLDRERVVGGHLAAGAAVGVFLSLPKDGDRAASTSLLLHQVLVSRVDGGAGVPTADGGKVTATPAATSVLVTLAVSAADAEKVVFGAEHGTLWLSLEQPGSTDDDTRKVTAENVHK